VITIINWFLSLEAWFKRAERQRIRRLEADLGEARRALGFYARQDHYPAFFVKDQGGVVLEDSGKRARTALYSLTVREVGESISWSMYRDPVGMVQAERREVRPV